MRPGALQMTRGGDPVAALSLGDSRQPQKNVYPLFYSFTYKQKYAQFIARYWRVSGELLLRVEKSFKQLKRGQYISLYCQQYGWIFDVHSGETVHIGSVKRPLAGFHVFAN